jgi:hypothetical protein
MIKTMTTYRNIHLWIIPNKVPQVWWLKVEFCVQDHQLCSLYSAPTPE